MKSLMLLWQKVANESATRCCTSATRDIKTVTSRTKHEGFSFLTITLANYGKDFQKALDIGYVDHEHFAGFKRSAGLPAFLQGFLGRVFDRNSGTLLNEPSIEAIIAVRQLTLMFSKILLDCTPARERDAMDKYIECEQEVKRNDANLAVSDRRDFRRIASMLYAGALVSSDRKVYELDLLPKHGPGATADKLTGNGKYRQSTWPRRLESILPSGEFLLPNWRHTERFNGVNILEPGAEIPVKVISVPKTLKTPRIIGIEPTSMQYAQQALLPAILESLQGRSYLRRTLGFIDQTPNQNLAREGSLSGTLATLDLSEASDRVSNQLVRDILRNHPHLLSAVDSARSQKADVPGHGVKRLAKFASMGSALTFPFEAMVFLTIVFLGIERELGVPLDEKTIDKFSHLVRIYGDDIIVPVEFVRSVVDTMTTFGAVVNVSKSFWTGKFRESCGKEYYDGHDVSIVKVRRVFPTQRRHVPEVISMVSLRNQLYWSGYWETCKWLDEEIGKIIKYFPVVLPSSPVLGRQSALGYLPERMSEHLHRPEVKGWVVNAQSPLDHLDGSDALLKCLLLLERREASSSHRELDSYHSNKWCIGMPTDVGEHLERAGRPQSVNIKLRWTTPY